MHSEASIFTGRLSIAADGRAEMAAGRAGCGGVPSAALAYADAASRCGRILLAATAEGVAWIGVHESVEYLESELRSDYRHASLLPQDPVAEGFLAELVAYLENSRRGLRLPIALRATPFQLAVWRELCAIPRGRTRSYGEIASRLGRPAAVRAVGRANGANPLAIAIPCHRVIGNNGGLTGYRWGIEIKRRLLAHEGALSAAAAPAATRRSAGDGLESSKFPQEPRLRKS